MKRMLNSVDGAWRIAIRKQLLPTTGIPAVEGLLCRSRLDEAMRIVV